MNNLPVMQTLICAVMNELGNSYLGCRGSRWDAWLGHHTLQTALHQLSFVVNLIQVQRTFCLGQHCLVFNLLFVHLFLFLRGTPETTRLQYPGSTSMGIKSETFRESHNLDELKYLYNLQLFQH